MKLILGLIWALILHFQIKAIFKKKKKEQKEDEEQGGGDDENSYKKFLLEWIRNQVKDYNLEVNNFTSSFRDGKLLNALIQSKDPSLVNQSIDSLDPVVFLICFYFLYFYFYFYFYFQYFLFLFLFSIFFIFIFIFNIFYFYFQYFLFLFSIFFIFIFIFNIFIFLFLFSIFCIFIFLFFIFYFFKENSVQNNLNAIEILKEKFGVPLMIEAADISGEDADEKIMMTYVSIIISKFDEYQLNENTRNNDEIIVEEKLDFVEEKKDVVEETEIHKIEENGHFFIYYFFFFF